MMSDLMVPSKRPRAPSFSDKNSDYSETHAASVGSDSFPEEEIGQAQVKNFLEVCRFCKKNLSHDKDIFMYGHFGAFCTLQCRAKQMACDIFRGSSEKNAAKAKKGRMCWTKQRPKESKDEGLGNRESNTPPRFYI